MWLKPKEFNAHLAHMGQRFLWSKAYRCPCVSPHSGAAAPNCPVCRGKSWFWDNPVEGIAGVANQSIQLRWSQFGLWQDGDIVISIPENSPLYEMGQFDRVITLNNTDYFSLLLVRGGPNERLLDPVERITRVFWLDENGTIVDGEIPTIGADGVPVWTSGAPPMGTRYTITGTRYAEYFCWGQYPGDRNQHMGARLPRRAILRRFDLFARDLG